MSDRTFIRGVMVLALILAAVLIAVGFAGGGSGGVLMGIYGGFMLGTTWATWNVLKGREERGES